LAILGVQATELDAIKPIRQLDWVTCLASYFGLEFAPDETYPLSIAETIDPKSLP